MSFVPPTVMAIDGIPLGDYAARGINMTFNPIASGSGLQRSVNGTLLDLTSSQFHKYQASITCSDIDSPTLADVWQGKIVTVTILPGLGIPVTNISMMVDSWSTSQDEWGAVSNWTINLLEV